MNESESGKSIAAMFLLAIPAFLLWGWGAATLWGWFVVRVWGVPPLTIPQAIGLGVIISFCRPTQFHPQTKPGWYLQLGNMCQAICLVAIGWVIQHWA